MGAFTRGTVEILCEVFAASGPCVSIVGAEPEGQTVTSAYIAPILDMPDSIEVAPPRPVEGTGGTSDSRVSAGSDENRNNSRSSVGHVGGLGTPDVENARKSDAAVAVTDRIRNKVESIAPSAEGEAKPKAKRLILCYFLTQEPARRLEQLMHAHPELSHDMEVHCFTSELIKTNADREL